LWRKRPSLAFLVLLVAAVAPACGSSVVPSRANAASRNAVGAPGARVAKVGLVYDVGGRGDASYNDSAAAGLERAQAEFGVVTHSLTPNQGGEDRAELLRLLSEQRYQLVFAVGFLFADAVEKVAKEFPDTTYAIIDAVVDAPNVVSLTFAPEQGSFVVGAAAALKSQTGRVGFLGGVETGQIRSFEAGFAAGARYVDPRIRVEVKYISQPPDFTGFADPARGKEVGLALYEQGADVVYHASGSSGQGLFEAAREVSARGAKVWVIGVDADQYQVVDAAVRPFILTSMLKRVDLAVYETVKAFVGSSLHGGRVSFDLRSGGIGYATSGGSIDDIKDQLESLKAKIADGEITVPSTP